MEFQSLESSVLDKKLRDVLKLAYHLIRKGLVSSKKLFMHIIDRIYKGRVVMKSPSNLSFLSHSKYPKQGDYGAYEYEFSCSNTPIPGYFQGSKKKHQFFPCISFPEVLQDQAFELPEEVIFVPNPKTPEYKFNIHFFTPDRGDKRSPIKSPFNVRISDYSSCPSEDESDEAYGKVDHEAEEFIKRFYEQLRAQY